MLRVWRWILILAVAGGMSSFAAAAKVDTNTEALLRKIAATFKEAKTAEVDLRLGAKMKEGGDLVADYTLAVARSNRFALQLKGEALGASAFSDGTNAITYIPKLNIYTTQAAPPDLRGLEADSGNTMGAMAFISALFSGDPYESILSGVLEATNAPPEKIGEQVFQRVNFRQEGLDWNLLVAPGDKPMLRRIEVQIPQLQLTLDFTNWKFNGEIAASRFHFTPPADAKKVASLADATDKEEEGEDSDLVDEPLPSLKLKILDGGTWDTASIRGKETLVVIWSGAAEHCQNALRGAADAVAGMKGAALQTINIDEKPDKAVIKGLLERNKVSAKNAAIDEKQVVAEEFGIEGVPMTFLVDKKGVVRKAFLGYHKDFCELVKKELEAVRAEKEK